MSKLYKDLRYDTDYVMQPGDPVTSPNGSTQIRADDSGKGFIETYGEEVEHFYDITVSIPQVSGATCKLRLESTADTAMTVTILSIDGWDGAEPASSEGSEYPAIMVNGSEWGTLSCWPAWDDGTDYPAGTVFKVSNYYDSSISEDFVVTATHDGEDGQYCPWTDFARTRPHSSKEILTVDRQSDHTHSAVVSPGGDAQIRISGSGKGFVETFGASIANSYDITVDIPQVPGASCRIRLRDTDDTAMSITILSIDGWAGAEPASDDESEYCYINVNGSEWGYVSCWPISGSDEFPPESVFEMCDQEVVVSVTQDGGSDQYCTWRDLKPSREITSKEISTTDHTHSVIQSANGKTFVSANDNGHVTVTAGTELPATATLDSLRTSLGLAESSTLGDAAAALGLSDSSTLETARQEGGIRTSDVVTAHQIIDPATAVSSGYAADALATKQALATKANISDVNNSLATKANTSDMNTALAKKANTSDVNTALATKANTSDMTTALAAKVDTTAMTAALNTKQDKLPSIIESDLGKVLGVMDAQGTLGWVEGGGGGGSFGGNSRYVIHVPTQTITGTNAEIALKDQAMNQVVLPSTITTVTMSFPDKTPFYARDFFIRLTITGPVPSITWQDANGNAIDFDVDFDWNIEQGVNLLMFTETAQ